jgi:hypothetical protein
MTEPAPDLAPSATPIVADGTLVHTVRPPR